MATTSSIGEPEITVVNVLTTTANGNGSLRRACEQALFGVNAKRLELADEGRTLIAFHASDVDQPVDMGISDPIDRLEGLVGWLKTASPLQVVEATVKAVVKALGRDKNERDDDPAGLLQGRIAGTLADSPLFEVRWQRKSSASRQSHLAELSRSERRCGLRSGLLRRWRHSAGSALLSGALLCIAVAPALLFQPGSAMADCSAPPFPVTCTGDVVNVDLTVVNSNIDFTTNVLTVEDLTRNPISVALVGKGESTVALSVLGPSLQVEFDGGTFGLQGDSALIFVSSAGANGLPGDSIDSTFNSVIAGNGQWAGNGGSASVVVTSGFVKTNAGGIIASSQGGTGGHGGDASTGIGNAQGGKGNTGGSSNGATVNFSQSVVPVTTVFDNNPAVRVESIAGDGGNGGSASAGGDAEGGDGGAGGRGGLATFGSSQTPSKAVLQTQGDQSHGLLVRSYGGGGGNGGDGNGVFGKGAGGAAAGSGPGGEVQVYLDGTIATEGARSDGILAQSVGGFSGSGGSASGLSTYGADGQSAGGGDTVTVFALEGSEISTDGDESNGIHAQSVGGGGGSGGDIQGLVALGGTGSAGGDASGVGVYFQGSEISTSGYKAKGIFAQSIGGGGGSGSSARAVNAIGGASGPGGNAGSVVVSNAGSVSTTGAFSPGVHLQSIGGGGGDGAGAVAPSVLFAHAVGGDGGAGGAGGPVTYQEQAETITISTTGQDSPGILAESVANGGGNGGGAIAVDSASLGIGVAIGTGGVGGSGNAAGQVTVGTGATITTSGDGSDAISVKSIGGSGGSGGYSLAGGGVAIGLEVDVAVGSIGGTAGDGGAVSVTSNGALSTAGEHASGVEAKSAGGGGGDASLVVSGSALSLGDSGVAVGKSGQAGGNGGEVAVIAGESIATQGAASFGIEAQSLGGSGGSGSVTVAADAVSVVKLTVATRGGGGDGGVGGDVTVDSSADISTMGERADAVSAQSLGGSGGGSGVVISASVVSAAALNVAAGGAADDTDPGDAGNSGDVKVTQTGKITTEGEQANGILAQSIAGTGGNAEATISANVVSLGTLDVGVGGSGGAAGTSGSVDVVNQGSVTTLGAYADAIRALSVGGDGGQGSAAVNSTGASIVSASFAVGGSGGDGGQAGDVAVTNEGALTVAGNYGAAITAQSQGGNGGSGGLSVSAGISFNPDPAFPAGSVDLSFGGSGGDGGTAGEVQVTNAAGIVNEGSQGFGINALSLGGSGGTGGNSYTGSIDVASEVSINVAVSVGGSGGDGSVGNAVSVENSGSILTTNFMTPAIHAQSLGGSGGSGGGAYALYGLMDVLNLEADFAIELATVVGGAGGTGMDGGAVSVANGGLIETKQGGSHGIYAASTGGGGGSGGLAAALALDLEFKKKEDVPDEPSDGEDAENTVGSINFVASVGGSGGAAGDGDSVDVVNNAAILTEGQEAVGIKALSTGGGGGRTVSNKALFVNALCSQPLVKNVKKLNCKDPDDPTQEVLLEFDLKVAVGGSGGASGSGGTVTVDNAGAITTLGPSSPAISAFSTGGGGGSGGSSQTSLEPWIPLDDALALDAAVNGGDGGIFKSLTDYSTVEVFVGGSGGAQGDGGEIDITNTEILVTEGDQSNAIEAFSTGGGGGSFGQGGSGILSRAVLPNKWAVGGRGSGGGDGGDIVIRNEGTIVTSGEDSVGIFAQSTGGGGGAAGDVQGLWNLELVKLNFGACPVATGRSADRWQAATSRARKVWF